MSTLLSLKVLYLKCSTNCCQFSSTRISDFQNFISEIRLSFENKNKICFSKNLFHFPLFLTKVAYKDKLPRIRYYEI